MTWQDILYPVLIIAIVVLQVVVLVAPPCDLDEWIEAAWRRENAEREKAE